MSRSIRRLCATPIRASLPRLLAAAAASVIVATLALAQPATAAAPVPPTPSGLPSAVEGLAAYVGATSCDATAKPGSTALGSLLTSTYAGTTYNVARPCGSDSLATTEHYDGRAVDWMVNARNTTQLANANAALKWMLATDTAGNAFAAARRLGVMYIIWNNRTWSAYRPTEGWREYNGCLDPSRAGTAYDTTCHRNHVHFSLSWAGAMKRSSYWSKTVAQPEFGPCRPWYLNWAAPSTGINLTRCVAPAKLLPLPSATSLGKQLVSYSGMYLREGKTGPAVSAVQTAIGAAATGSFTAATRGALIAWQTGQGISATGVTDVATWRALTRRHAAPPVALGLDGDFGPDLLARQADGTLTLHPTASSTSGRFVNTGWQGLDRVVSAGDFSGDGRGDVMARRPDGTLWLYAGTGLGTFRGGVLIGSGWQIYKEILSPGDFTGDGHVDVLARRADGTLWMYAGNGRGGWAAGGKRVGTGWQGFDQVMSPGDFTGDGRGDVLARRPDGTLWLYAGNGQGGWAAGGKQVGTGWQGFAQILAGGDRDRDGRSDVLALRPDGTLLQYRGNGSGGWAAGGVVVGNGWDRFDLVVGIR